MSETNLTSKVKTFFSPIANLNSVKELGSSVSRNIKIARHGLGNTQRRLQQMFSLNISGPFSDFISSFIIMYFLYYFIKKAIERMDYNNVVAFIGHCVDYWFYIIIILIIFSTIIRLL
tara:strand:- start:316 stop:669 length:354 start_codon:yes stop_codon:yes gene_type:complete